MTFFSKCTLFRNSVEILMKLYSYRWSVAYGNHWKIEREVSDDTANDWLKVFQRDEPAVDFVVSKRKPRVPANKDGAGKLNVKFSA